jgi:diguanylate cyclase (GGDEF)-like protein
VNPSALPPAFDPRSLFWLGLALVVLSALHSALLWLGQRRETGLGQVLAAGFMQGLGLLALLARSWPGQALEPVLLFLLAGTGWGLWALRRFAGLPGRMNRWARLALASWLLLAVVFHLLGLAWVRGLVPAVTLAALVLGMSREVALLTRRDRFRLPAQVCAALAVLLALAALGAGFAAALFPAADAFSSQDRAWFFFAVLGAQQLFLFLLALVQGQRLQARLERLVATDPVTGLASVEGFRERLDRAVGRSLRTGRMNSLMLLELDGYATLVAEHGPAPAALILEAFGRTLKNTLREADFTGRLEGPRFAALLHLTPPEEALLAAERLRAAWADLPLALDAQSLRCTLSAGVASTRERIEASEDLLALALDRVAIARLAGGNSVEGAPRLD